MKFLYFQKVELPAYSSTEYNHVAHQNQGSLTSQIQLCQNNNLQGLKAISDVLLDNFINIY